MKYEFLNNENAEQYISYLKKAFAEEPYLMTTEYVDEDEIRRRLQDPFFQHTRSILALSDDQAVARIEYHFYGCIQDGYRMAYVDWVYVLPEFRRKGIARQLFREFEKDCERNAIHQFYLIRSEEEAANGFYGRYPEGKLSEEPIMRKHIQQEDRT